MISLPTGRSEKGQDLIEYALLLALLVAVGVLIYSQSGLSNSLQTIFRNSGSLIETAASEGTNGANNEEHRTIPELVGQAITDGTLTLDRGQYLFSGTDAASQVAGNLGIPFAPGDAWTIGRQASRDGTTDYYVLMYYSAEQRGDLSNYATGGSDWNWTVNDRGFYTTRKGSQIQVPVDYYIHDASTGAQNDGLRQTYFTGNSGSEGKANLVHPSGSSGYGIR